METVTLTYPDLLPGRPFTGIPVTTASPADVIAWIVERSKRDPRLATDVHLLAGHSLYFLEHDRRFENVLQTATLTVADGRWLEFLTKRSPLPLQRIRGQDLMLHLCGEGLAWNLSHFFIGADSESLDALTSVLRIRFPGINISGTLSFPWGELEPKQTESLFDRIERARPDIVWMGISSPRQNIEGQRIARRLSVTTIAVGAAFSFVSGQKRSAPRWMQRFGMEWLFRFAAEPRRLARRYVAGSFVALRRIARHRRADDDAVRQWLGENRRNPGG